MLYNTVKRKTRISPCSWDQLVKQTKIIWEMPVLKYQWQRNGPAYMRPTRLIFQAGTIQGSGLWTDTIWHGICWDFGVDSLGASVPDRCCSPASVVGPCGSPGVCALSLLTLLDCSKGWCVSAAPEWGMLHTHVHTSVHTHTQTYTQKSLSSSQPPRTAFNLEEEEKKKENDNEGGELQVLCREERER